MGNLQIANFRKNKLYIGLGFMVVFVLLTIAVAPMILVSISDTPKQTSTDNYVDMYYLASHAEEFEGKSITTIGIARHYGSVTMFEDFQLDSQSDERLEKASDEMILVVTRPAGLPNPDDGSLIELSGKWEFTDLEGGHYYLNATKLTSLKATNFSQKDFPLEVDLGKRVFTLGEKITFSATITNKSGKDVNVLSNGEMPCAFFHNINDNTTHGETTVGVYQILKANDKISRVFEFEASETGTYILDVHYCIGVNQVWIQDKIDDIIIEVK
jgi:hypothetical protein